jgi:hypothetical protein
MTRLVPIELRADSRRDIEDGVVVEGTTVAARGVVVLGMGRSGTSSVTRMFARVGFFVGHEGEIMGAAESNPTGHWEHLSIWRRNEEVLAKLGGSWFAPPPDAAQIAARRWAVPVLETEVERILDQANGAPIAVKDPRIGVLMALWDQVLRDRLHPVLVIRNPVEIALSLSRRDGTPLPFGLAAWEFHMTGLLKHLQGRVVTIAQYGHLVKEPDYPQTIAEAAIANIDSRRTSHLRPQEARGAFAETLYRNRAVEDQHYEHLTSRQLDLWRTLSSLPPGCQSIETPVELHAPSSAAEAAVRCETERLAGIEERAGLNTDLAAERGRAATVADSLAVEQARNVALLADLEAQRDRADRAVETHAQAERWLASIQDSISWRITQPLRALKQALRAPGPR